MKIIEKIMILLQNSFYGISGTRILVALVVFLALFFFRKLLTKIVIKSLVKIACRTRMAIEEKIIRSIESPIRFLFIVIGVWFFIRILNFDVEQMLFMNRILRTMIAICVFWLTYYAVDAVAVFWGSFIQDTETQLNQVFLYFTKKILKVVVVVIGMTIIIQEWGYNITGIVAGFGLGGLAFALAAKDTVANFFGSLMIVLDKPFIIGDWIMTDNIDGTVEEVGFRSTKIRTWEQALVTVPNSLMSNIAITNWSKMGKRKLSFEVRISFKTELDKIKKCIPQIKDIVENHKDMLSENVIVVFEEVGESFYKILVQGYCKEIDKGKFLEVKQDINFKVINILDELGVLIAIPSMNIIN